MPITAYGTSQANVTLDIHVPASYESDSLRKVKVNSTPITPEEALGLAHALIAKSTEVSQINARLIAEGAEAPF